jgi:hypothetical protein
VGERAWAGARQRAAVLLAAVLAAALLAGCGSSAPPGTSADPALAVPANAVIYAGASVRPSGALAQHALAAGRALTHQADPYLRLLAALQTPGSPTLNFKQDVAPWLGPNAAIFLTSLRSSAALPTLLEHGLLGSGGSGSAFPFDSEGAEGAIVLDTSNSAKALSFLNAQAAHASAHATSFHGVSYQVSSGGVAFGLVHRFAVIGTEAALRSVIETTAGASSLARSEGYSKLLAAAPSEALAHLYLKPAPQTKASGQEGLSGVLQVLAGSHEANISVVPAGSSLALDADTLASEAGSAGGGLLSADSESARALDELPGESWLALGLGHVGATLSKDAQDIQGLVSLGSSLSNSGPTPPTAPTGAFSLNNLLGDLIAPLELLGANTAEAKREFASWMGSAGIFATGSSLFELRAGVVISSTDPAHSRAAVGELGAELRKSGASVSPASIPGADAALVARLPGLPLPLDIANVRTASGASKFVIGLTEASVTVALNPSSTLESAPARAAAAGALGERIQPSLVLNFPSLLSIFEGIGLLEAPPISQFVPYLRAATTLAGGGHQLSGEVQRFRLVLGL